MSDNLIWNENMTMFFRASAFNGAYILYPSVGADKGRHWVRVCLRGSFRRGGQFAGDVGFPYETCPNEESAKRSLARLARKLSPIEATQTPSRHELIELELEENKR